MLKRVPSVVVLLLLLLLLLLALLRVGVVWVLSLALLGRMRLLGGVIDMVIRPYSVVARQCVSNAWVPPERTALDGRRTLYGENWVNLSPSGLLGRGLGRGRTFVSYGENGARFAWVPLWEDAAGLLLAQKPGTCVGGTGRRRGWYSISGGSGSSQCPGPGWGLTWYRELLWRPSWLVRGSSRGGDRRRRCGAVVAAVV